MRRLVVIRSYPQGPRCWVAGQRTHHGAVGALLLAASRRHFALRFLGLLLIAHDLHDWRVWFKRECVPNITLDLPDPVG